MFFVAGVTGHTGSVVADTLLGQGKKVRVFVRDAKKAEGFRARGAEVVTGELHDEAAVTGALRGTEGAYLLLPPLLASNSVLAEQAVLADRLARAVEQSGVPHVVFLSSVGAHLPTGTGPIRSLHFAEKLFARTKANVTALRAAYFMENDLSALGTIGQGFLAGFSPRELAYDRVATVDIGVTAAKALVEGGRGKSVIELAGPRAYSLDDLAAVLGKLTGKTLSVQVGPETAIVPTFKGFGMADDIAELYREMTHGLNAGHLVWEGQGTHFVRGPTDLETFWKRALERAAK